MAPKKKKSVLKGKKKSVKSSTRVIGKAKHACEFC